MTDDPTYFSAKDIRFVPTIQHYERLYGKSVEGNDAKGVSVFRNYESTEKLRRLQQELEWVKNGRVADEVLDNIVGKKRKGKWQSYEQWGEKMLLWIAAAKK